MTIQMIELNQLVPSQANVRKTNVSAGIEELAASIEAHGLLQNLTVRACGKVKYEVVAGGRRLAAMTILRRQKKLAKDFPVPCHVIDEADAGEISLAENVVRLAMHPADQFTAFKALADQDMGVEDIAARFGVSAAVVRQRLKLASVSPALMDVYREGDMTLDQLMAFTISDDHTAQEAAWFEQPAYNRNPHGIRATLTEAQVEADDRRVAFAGLETYLAAGGGMNRDLFQPEHEGYLTDPALLDSLVVAKLNEATDEVRAEGWAWVEVMVVRDHAVSSSFGRVRPVQQPLDADAQSKRDSLMAEYDALVAAHGEEPEDEAIAEQMQTLWEQIDAIEESLLAWTPDDIARAGAMLSLDYEGSLIIDRGLVRADEMRRMRGAETSGEQDASERPKSSGLSAALTESLTAERTAALRAMMMDNRQVALAGLCHALVLPLFYPIVTADRACLQVRLKSRDLGHSADTVETSRAGVMLAERHEVWAGQLPEDADDLFGWLLVQECEVLLDLLTYCAAQSIDAVKGKSEWAGDLRHAHADELAGALKLDMRDWWQPTRANYLGRVSKALALEAVREGVSVQAAENLADLKKDKLADAAERRLAGTGWLPEPLRSSASQEAEADDEMKEAA